MSDTNTKYMTVVMETVRCETCGRWYSVEQGLEYCCPYRICSDGTFRGGEVSVPHEIDEDDE